MECEELQRIIEAILFAAGERVEISRLAQTLEVDPKDITEATDALADKLAYDRRGIRILKLEQGYQMVSSGEMADYITKTLETRKPPKLSASQLETLTIIAYYQPATKAMVAQIRGADSSYSVAALLNKKLIEEAGRLNVPGRPIQYRTTPDFLRTFGLQSLEELPPIDKIAFGEPIELPEPMEELEVQLNAVRERALRDARAAREAEQRKNDLVVYLAHDLKTPLTSATGKKGTLNEIRLNTSTITFQYTLPGYLEAQNEWDADWTEYVHGTPDVTVTFADGSTKKLELQELHGDLEPEVMKTYTHYFGLADAIDLENAETLTVNGTDYTLHG